MSNVRLIFKKVYTCPEGIVTGTSFETHDIEDEIISDILKDNNPYCSSTLIGVELLSKDIKL